MPNYTQIVDALLPTEEDYTEQFHLAWQHVLTQGFRPSWTATSITVLFTGLILTDTRTELDQLTRIQRTLPFLVGMLFSETIFNVVASPFVAYVMERANYFAGIRGAAAQTQLAELEASLYNPALEAHLSKDALSSLASTLKQKVGMQADMRRLQLATIMAIAGELTCPIGLGLLHDPVVIPKTGSVYSRAAITAYLNTFAKLPEHYLRDPATNIRLNQADAQQLEICGTIQTILTSLLTQVRIIEAEVSSLNDGIDAEFPQPTISADIHESPTLLFARARQALDPDSMKQPEMSTLLNQLLDLLNEHFTRDDAIFNEPVVQRSGELADLGHVAGQEDLSTCRTIIKVRNILLNSATQARHLALQLPQPPALVGGPPQMSSS